MKVAEDQKNVTTNKLQSKKEQPGTFDLVLHTNLSKMIAPIKKKRQIYHFDDTRWWTWLLYAYILFNGFIYFNNKEKLDLYRWKLYFMASVQLGFLKSVMLTKMW